MSCNCTHVALAHQYRVSSAANDGECLAPQCSCDGYTGASDPSFALQAWDNWGPSEDGPGPGALTPGSSQGLAEPTRSSTDG
jgi:hypothetical protein